MYSTCIHHKRNKLDLTAKKYSFLFYNLSYNLRIIQEHFEPKISRKTRIFSVGQKNNFLIKKKRVSRSYLKIGLRDWRQFQDDGIKMQQILRVRPGFRVNPGVEKDQLDIDLLLVYFFGTL